MRVLTNDDYDNDDNNNHDNHFVDAAADDDDDDLFDILLNVYGKQLRSCRDSQLS